MQEQANANEIRARLALIETMITEGRRTAQSWGWVFLLWGIAYYLAIAWASWGGSIAILGGRTLAWPITMAAAVTATILLASRRQARAPLTTIGRAVGAVWLSIGISIFLIVPAIGFLGKLDPAIFLSLLGALLGTANCASGLILRWKAQVVCAVLWWATIVVACFASAAQVTATFLAVVFVCQVVFGIYAMTLDARRSRHRVVHA
jgi:hypothetical protein